MKTFPIRSFHMVFHSGTAFAFVSSLAIVVHSSVVLDCFWGTVLLSELLIVSVKVCRYPNHFTCLGNELRGLDLTVAHCLFLRYLPQVEIKMKKTEAIRWEKLEGEGILPSLKHFSPSPSQYQEAYISSSEIMSAWQFPALNFCFSLLFPFSFQTNTRHPPTTPATGTSWWVTLGRKRRMRS